VGSAWAGQPYSYPKPIRAGSMIIANLRCVVPAFTYNCCPGEILVLLGSQRPNSHGRQSLASVSDNSSDVKAGTTDGWERLCPKYHH
jgi:hypothetical protein